MDDFYFKHVRKEIEPLLPPFVSRLVDVGCGSGGTLAWLQSLYPDAHTIGLDKNPENERELERIAKEVHILDLDKVVPDLGSPDLILFLDVLEHLVNPREVLKQVCDQLRSGGTIIVSVPNVAHLSVALPLIMRGEFTYRDAGILDNTHLRFFVQKSAIQLVEAGGFIVDRGLFGIEGPISRTIDKISFHALRRRLAKQFILRGVRPIAGSQPRPTVWELVAPASESDIPLDTSVTKRILGIER